MHWKHSGRIIINALKTAFPKPSCGWGAEHNGNNSTRGSQPRMPVLTQHCLSQWGGGIEVSRTFSPVDSLSPTL